MYLAYHKASVGACWLHKHVFNPVPLSYAVGLSSYYNSPLETFGIAITTSQFPTIKHVTNYN